MSRMLKGDISRGESLADEVLRAVFNFGKLKPGSDENSQQRQKEGIPAEDISPQATEVQFKAEEHANDGKRHLLLACSGSVATIKLPNMLRALSKYSEVLSTRVILTASSKHFLQGQADEQPTVGSLEKIAGVDSIHLDEDEWDPVWTRGAPILHIELRRWADLLVIAPLSANTLAKIVNGLCDNLLTSVVRAWDTESTVGFTATNALEPAEAESSVTQAQAFPGDSGWAPKASPLGKKQILLAPAMNTAMWSHPITGRQLKMLQEEWHWIKVLLPSNDKMLACGDVGTGAMKEWSAIVRDIEDALSLPRTEEATTQVALR